MEINWGAQRHPSSWLFVVKEMDGGSLCQPHAAAITPAAMMDGGEGKGGLGVERGRQRGASITPLNLPVTARAWGGGECAASGGGELHPGCWSKVYFFPFLYPELVSSPFRELGLQGLDSLNVLITPIDFRKLVGFCWTYLACVCVLLGVCLKYNNPTVFK